MLLSGLHVNFLKKNTISNRFSILKCHEVDFNKQLQNKYFLIGIVRELLNFPLTQRVKIAHRHERGRQWSTSYVVLEEITRETAN